MAGTIWEGSTRPWAYLDPGNLEPRPGFVGEPAVGREPCRSSALIVLFAIVGGFLPSVNCRHSLPEIERYDRSLVRKFEQRAPAAAGSIDYDLRSFLAGLFFSGPNPVVDKSICKAIADHDRNVQNVHVQHSFFEQYSDWSWARDLAAAGAWAVS